jgi:hypothetical protein
VLEETRNSKLRQIVRKLNRIRRRQKQQIDILCNDILGAHGEFIKHLKNFRFAADFFENLLDATNLDSLARATGEFLTKNINDCNIAVIFATTASPEIHFFSTSPKLEDIPSQLGPCLTTKLVEAVCHSSRICTCEELCRMEFFASPAILKKISLAAIGLNNSGPALGMLLIYRSADSPLNNSELTQVSSVIKGLSKAVKSLRGTTTCDNYA